MKIKVKKEKKPTIFRQIFDIMYERAMARRALRLLSKQVWGVEFLSYVLKKCAQQAGTDLEMVVYNQAGSRIVLRSTQLQEVYDQPDIFDQIDDKLAVQEFLTSRGVL